MSLSPTSPQLATEWLKISRPVEVFVISRAEKDLPKLPRQTSFSWFHGCVRFSTALPLPALGLDHHSAWVKANPWLAQPTVVFLGPALTYETRALAQRSAALCAGDVEGDPVEQWFQAVTAFLLERGQLGVVITNNHRCGIPTETFRPRYVTLPPPALGLASENPIVKFLLHMAKPTLAVPFNCYMLIENLGQLCAEVYQTLVQKPGEVQAALDFPEKRRGRPRLSPEQQEVYVAIAKAYDDFQKNNQRGGRKEFVARTKKTIGAVFTQIFSEPYTTHAVQRAISYTKKRRMA